MIGADGRVRRRESWPRRPRRSGTFGAVLGVIALWGAGGCAWIGGYDATFAGGGPQAGQGVASVASIPPPPADGPVFTSFNERTDGFAVPRTPKLRPPPAERPAPPSARADDPSEQALKWAGDRPLEATGSIDAASADDAPTPAALAGAVVQEGVEVLFEPTETVVPPLVHIVAAGETPASIALRYSTTEQALKRANGLDVDFLFYPGLVLVLPDGSEQPKLEFAPATAYTPPPILPSPNLGQYRSDRASQLVRPVSGGVLSAFGELVGGQPLEGVRLGGRPGDDVLAAADGEIGYVRSGGARGDTVLLRHYDGRSTIYARLAGVKVSRGQRVTAGEPLARIAAPSAGGRPHLYFELRKGPQAIDPTPFF